MDPAAFASPRRFAACLVLALGLAWPAGASAQSAAERAAMAQGLYDSAAELIKAGKYTEACPKLEESQRLDPAMGTQFFLATCYENTRRPTSAWSLFLEVAEAAKAAGNTVREGTARARAAALEPKLPRLRVTLDDATAATPGLEVERDGVALKRVAWGAPIPVDLGDHKLRARAPGKETWETTVTVSEPGQKLEVKVPALRDAPPEAAPPPAVKTPEAPAAPPAPVATGLPGLRIAAIATGAVGLVGIVAGSVVGAMAKSTWSQAKSECLDQAHMMACGTMSHDDSVKSLSLATGSTVAFVAGGVAVAGAVVLWLVAPSPKPATAAQIRIAPLVAAGGAGALVEGTF